ncbi:DUF3592 domain-containing protein [Hymenobacter chitinivorans]|uniref:DUF3592 domain-containing protein n=1 Tax=Hymenobacter chitinivorans DSM 11115 TaxID=1121954 RepID=A0A2M9BSR4_9BACT|nr:hypothetical protein [Hymenobacter chitinivorans]PJJ61000.1 hypothetical protein CLV45_2437 [Hymenobacter chitinivorans DSM 11115]
MQTPDSTNQPTTTRQVISIVLGLVLGIAFFAGVVYFIKADRDKTRALILKNPGYATGIITRRRTYKGRRVTVQYTVAGAEYSLRARVTRNFLRTHQKGDTTAVIYSKADPSSAILKAKLRPSTN